MDKKTLSVLILVFTFWTITNALTPFFSHYAVSLNIDATQIGLLIAFVCIIRIFLQPVLGLLISKRIFTLTLLLPLLLLMIANLGYGYTSNYLMLLLSRAAEAIAICLFTIQIRVALNFLFDKDKLVSINHYYAGIKSASSLVGPAIAGLVIQYYGFQNLCLVFSAVLAILLLLMPSNISNIDKKSSSASNSIELSAFFKNAQIRRLASVHFLEMFGFGLWIAGWAVYATEILSWSESQIGLSFTVSALAGIMIIPLSNRFLRESFFLKIMIGLLLLACQAFAVLYLPSDSFAIWFAFFVGGVGGTLYFSSFHSYSAHLLSMPSIPIFYGLIGSMSYLGIAAGQLLTPYLWEQHGLSMPILIDGFIMLSVIIFFTVTNTVRSVIYE